MLVSILGDVLVNAATLAQSRGGRISGLVDSVSCEIEKLAEPTFSDVIPNIAIMLTKKRR